jgi:8-oxo-dGTP pyrophosphatase MutT (NUDIX family)
MALTGSSSADELAMPYVASTKMTFVSEKASWRCIVCGVAERDGSILLVRQQNTGDPEGGWWVLPGGVVTRTAS